MQRMLAVLAANPAADGAGLIAMVCFIAWPLFQARSMMLIAYIGNNLCFALHYALLGHWTAAAMNGLMSVQTVVAIVLVHQPRLRWMYYALTPVLALPSVVTWQGGAIAHRGGRDDAVDDWPHADQRRNLACFTAGRIRSQV
jgi:Bacterial inner membrane protein